MRLKVRKMWLVGGHEEKTGNNYVYIFVPAIHSFILSFYTKQQMWAKYCEDWVRHGLCLWEAHNLSDYGSVMVSPSPLHFSLKFFWACGEYPGQTRSHCYKADPILTRRNDVYYNWLWIMTWVYMLNFSFLIVFIFIPPSPRKLQVSFLVLPWCWGLFLIITCPSQRPVFAFVLCMLMSFTFRPSLQVKASSGAPTGFWIFGPYFNILHSSRFTYRHSFLKNISLV